MAMCALGGGKIHYSIFAAPAPLPLSLPVCSCNPKQVRNPTLHQSSKATGNNKAWDVPEHDQQHGLYTNDQSWAS